MARLAFRLCAVLLASMLACSAVRAEEWEDNGKVVHLSGDMFDGFLQTHNQALVVFYAPWCGHCKAMKADYAAASRKTDGLMPLAAVDCTADDNKDICSRYEVQGFPTIKFFPGSGKDPVPYQGARSSGDFISFVQENFEAPPEIDLSNIKKLRVKVLKQLLAERGVECTGCTEKAELVEKVKSSIHLPKTGPKPKKAKNLDDKYSGRSWGQDNRAKLARESIKSWDPEETIAHHVYDEEWKDFKAKNAPFFVMFHESWCGHCTSAKPHWLEATKQLKGVVTLAGVECAHNPETCRTNKIEGFPAFVYFESADSKGTKYTGPRDTDGFVNFGRHKALGEELMAQEPPRDSWEDSGEVAKVSAKEFDDLQGPFLTMFYAPWCGHCKQAKPEVASASNDLVGQFTFAAVDCTVEAELCSKHGVEGYPTFKYFENSSTEGERYNGGRTASDLVTFARSKISEDSADDVEGKDEL